jgi:hypothetical protein
MNFLKEMDKQKITLHILEVVSENKEYLPPFQYGNAVKKETTIVHKRNIFGNSVSDIFVLMNTKTGKSYPYVEIS